jgi:hypothetical protein
LIKLFSKKHLDEYLSDQCNYVVVQVIYMGVAMYAPSAALEAGKCIELEHRYVSVPVITDHIPLLTEFCKSVLRVS